MRDNKQTNERTNIEDRATQPMEAGGSFQRVANNRRVRSSQRRNWNSIN